MTKAQNYDKQAKALFISPDGNIYADYLICSGIIPAELKGQACPFAVNKHVPAPKPLNEADDDYTIDKGKPGDMCPPCVSKNLYHVEHWQGHRGQTFALEFLPLRLFKCRQWMWFVVPGL